ncbi:hypothetical protein C2R22_03815 [Salinigranum rubrum]|uniref:RNA ligase domain-containing protein n=1 Tax=Salinigranum rubrum TaxID=755307 RepID=A0A2I8VG47_9EURY|nr:hypothetical protein [Salinigranum rubrum]AUV80891.1 hypothetical protein C2R22_03815 [Salinigranum rubrum]
MQAFPSYPPAAEAPPALFERGHLWLHELVDGAPLRFQAQEDGRLRFGDDVRVFGDDAPPAYGHAVRHVRESFDRGALRAAVDDVESVVFFGRAMHRRGVDYDWDATPSFLGVDVWSEGEYRQPDRVEKIYTRLGLDPLNTVRAEVRAVDFGPGSYEFPTSAWYDGPAAGVLVRNKTGLRCALSNPSVGDSGGSTDADTGAGASASVDGDTGATVDDAEGFARRHVTTERLDSVARQLQAEGRPVTFDALYGRVVDRVARAHHRRLFEGGIDVRAFRSAAAETTSAYLAGRDDQG